MVKTFGHHAWGTKIDPHGTFILSLYLNGLKLGPNGKNEGLNAFLIYKINFLLHISIKNGMLLRRPILPHCATVTISFKKPFVEIPKATSHSDCTVLLTDKMFLGRMLIGKQQLGNMLRNSFCLDFTYGSVNNWHWQVKFATTTSNGKNGRALCC